MQKQGVNLKRASHISSSQKEKKFEQFQKTKYRRKTKILDSSNPDTASTNLYSQNLK